jgi:hypothetical protein
MSSITKSEKASDQWQGVMVEPEQLVLYGVENAILSSWWFHSGRG